MINPTLIFEKIDYLYLKGDKASENWYSEANFFCSNLSLIHGIPIRVIAGILSSLSVLKRWEQNKEMTETFLECQECKHTTTQAKKAELIYTMKDFNYGIDEAGLDKYIMSVLGGHKTKAFYHNIIYPQSSRYVTLDSWMLKAFNEGNLKPTTKQYQRLSEPFIIKADEHKIPVSSLQARIWTYLRNNKLYGKDF